MLPLSLMAEAPALQAIDPGVELLPDVPVSRSEEDLLGRGRLALR